VHRFLPLFSEFSGEKFAIGRIRPFKNNPDFVSVSSKFLREQGEPIHVVWRVRRRDGGYKIVDVIAEGISIAVTLRSEYVSVLKKNGGNVDGLTRVLRAKIEGL
jgi:phospholipid transport system substrate-binding protein